MKHNSRPSGPYYSTSQTAQMLGLSVGTVQRMVESGALQAYTTQGGHRRILASSVRRYCLEQGVPGAPVLQAHPAVCVVHPPLTDTDALTKLDALPHVQRISHPLELAGLHEEFGVFFIDARVGWLDWPELHRPTGLPAQARFIVYHSEALPAEQQAAVALHAQLHPGSISADLIQGYLLALAMPAACLPAPTPHINEPYNPSAPDPRPH